MNELNVEHQKIKSIKVTNGSINCVGDVFNITGDFEIELKDDECNCKKEEQEIETIECTEDKFAEIQWRYNKYPKEINIHVIGQGTYKNCRMFGKKGLSGDKCMDMQYSDFIAESEEENECKTSSRTN